MSGTSDDEILQIITNFMSQISSKTPEEKSTELIQRLTLYAKIISQYQAGYDLRNKTDKIREKLTVWFNYLKDHFFNDPSNTREFLANLNRIYGGQSGGQSIESYLILLDYFLESGIEIDPENQEETLFYVMTASSSLRSFYDHSLHSKIIADLVLKRGARLTPRQIQDLKNIMDEHETIRPIMEKQLLEYQALIGDDSDLVFVPTWPAALFHPPSTSTDFVSPTHTISPIAAHRGSRAFQGQTSPSQELRKKKLMLTREAQGDLSDNEFFGLIGSLISQDFEIIYKYEPDDRVIPPEEIFRKITPPLTENEWRNIFPHKLGFFKPDTDFEYLIRTPGITGVERDNLHILSAQDFEDLKLGLSQDHYKIRTDSTISFGDSFAYLSILIDAKFLSVDPWASTDLRTQKSLQDRIAKKHANTHPGSLLSYIEAQESEWKLSLGPVGKFESIQAIPKYTMEERKSPPSSTTVGYFSIDTQNFIKLDNISAFPNRFVILKISALWSRDTDFSAFSAEAFFKKMKEFAPNAVKFIFPEIPSLKQYLETSGENRKFIIEWTLLTGAINTLVNQSKTEKDILFAELARKFSRIDPPFAPRLTKGGFDIAIQADSASASLQKSASTETITYHMHRGAKYLSGPPFQELRTGIFQFKPEGTELKAVKIYQESGQEVSNPYAEFDISKTAWSCYELSLPKTILFSGEVIRLNSLSSEENIRFLENLPPGISLFRGSDDFFYLKNTSLKTVTFEAKYQLQSLPPPPADLLVLSRDRDDPAFQLLEFIKNTYKAHRLFKELVSTKAALPKFENWKQFQTECFEKRAGTCLTRSWCVYEQIKKEFPDLDCEKYLRVMDINNNHAALEIYSTRLEKWIPVDLGGGNDTKLERSSEIPAPIKHSTSLESPTSTTPFAESSGASESKGSDESKRHGGEALDAFLEVDPDEILSQKILKGLFQNTAPTRFNFGSEETHPTRTKPLLFQAHDQKSSLDILQAFRESTEKTGERIFYLNSPEQLSLYQESLLLKEKKEKKSETEEKAEGALETHRGDELGRFLEDIRRSGIPATLVIDWKKFPPEARVTLNDLLAKKPADRTLQGVKIPRQTRLVSLVPDLAQEDSSFRSRHEICSPTFAPPPQAASGSSDDEEKSEKSGESGESGESIKTSDLGKKSMQSMPWDLQGKPDWQSEIFGRILLQGHTPIWQKAEWLDSGPITLKLKNIDPANLQAIQSFIAEAQALGYFNYQGYHIPTSELSLELDTQPSSFKVFSDQISRITSQAEWSELPTPKPLLLNTYLFDYALLIPRLEADGAYFEAPGYLKAHQDSDLNLYITSNLTEGQWLCLCQNAQKFHVKLNLFLAPGVQYPKELFALPPTTASSASDKEDESLGASESKGPEPDLGLDLEKTRAPSFTPGLAKIYLSAQPERALQNLLERLPEDRSAPAKPWIIDIEDFNYEDLVESRRCKITGKDKDGLPQFDVLGEESALIRAIKAGQSVILKGYFSDALLQLMEPLLLDPAYASLTLLIETPSGAIEDPRLAYHPNLPEVITPILPIFPAGAPVSSVRSGGELPREIFTEILDESLSADDYIQSRKQLLLQALSTSPAVQLMGPPGVGKSSLIREFERDQKSKVDAGEIPETKIYREIQNLEAWAKDDSTDSLKILFIDEANLDDKHLTQFADLLRGGREILIKNSAGQTERIPLNEHHRIVFAGNPLAVGGDRRAQKLFEIFPTPEIHLQAFSKNYLLERLLGPILGMPINRDEEAIKTWLTEYYVFGLNIRELQEKALTWQAQKLDLSSMIASGAGVGAGAGAGAGDGSSETQVTSPASPSQKNNDFILTPNLQDIYAKINQFVRVRRAQTLGLLSQDTQGLGLGGVFIQGRPGFGKTELIRAILQENHYQPLPDFSHASSSDDLGSLSLGSPGNFYDKIEAGIPLEEKKARLLRAFENGWAVWIDEFDACTTGLEKFMNALMTGQHPETGKKATHPAFMVLATGNGAAMAGRKKLSSAAESRFLNFDMPTYSKEDLQAVIRHHRPDFPETLIQNIALKFERSKMSQPWLNLRDLVSQIHISKVKDVFQKRMAHKSPKSAHILHTLHENFSSKLEKAKNHPLIQLFSNAPQGIEFLGIFEKKFTEHANLQTAFVNTCKEIFQNPIEPKSLERLEAHANKTSIKEKREFLLALNLFLRFISDKDFPDLPDLPDLPDKTRQLLTTLIEKIENPKTFERGIKRKLQRKEKSETLEISQQVVSNILNQAFDHSPSQIRP
jgi:MoxR-like ATPase